MVAKMPGIHTPPALRYREVNAIFYWWTN